LQILTSYFKGINKPQTNMTLAKPKNCAGDLDLPPMAR